MLMLNRAALVLAIGLASSAHAATPYPNTEGFGRDVDPTTPWFQACLRVQKVQPPAPPPLPASCKAFDYYSKRVQAEQALKLHGKEYAPTVFAIGNYNLNRGNEKLVRSNWAIGLVVAVPLVHRINTGKMIAKTVASWRDSISA